MLDVPIMTPDGPSDISVPETVMAEPPWVRDILEKKIMEGCWGDGVAGVVTGVYVMSAITIGLESACPSRLLAASGAWW